MEPHAPRDRVRTPLLPCYGQRSANCPKEPRVRAISRLLPSLALGLAACHAGGDGAAVPGDRSDSQPYNEVSAEEEFRFRGTEPFWGGEVTGTAMTYRTPERPEGVPVTVSRFNGRGGFSYSGKLEGETFTMAVTPGQCSDGMSDRTYPFVVMFQRGKQELHGCAWSASHPYTGPAAP